MDIYEQILHYYRVDELSLRAIARKLNVDRKTVSKVVHAYEDAIAADPEGKPLYSMLDKARECGKKTGVVVTCHMADATPCDFCCHCDDRYKYDEVIAGYAWGPGRDQFGGIMENAELGALIMSFVK